MLDTALVSLGFYTLGATLGGIPALPVREKPLLLLSGALVLCLGVAALVPSQTDLANFVFPNPALFLISSCSGIAAVIAAAQYIPATWLQTLGGLSLVIMCIHEPVKRVLLKLTELASGIGIADLRAGIMTSLVMTAITLLVCIPPALIIRRFFPWRGGNRSHNITYQCNYLYFLSISLYPQISRYPTGGVILPSGRGGRFPRFGRPSFLPSRVRAY